MTTSPTAPTDYTELIRSGLRLFRASLKGIAGVVVMQVVTVSVLIMGSLSLVLNLMSHSQKAPAYTELLLVLLAGLIICGICLIFPIIYLKHFQASASGEVVRLRHILRHDYIYLKRLVPWAIIFAINLAYLSVVGMLAQFSGLLLFLSIPGFLPLIPLLMGPYLIVLEDCTTLDTMRRSFRLVRGHWWRTALYLVISVFVLLLFLLSITIPLTLLFTLFSGVSFLLIDAMQVIYALAVSALLPLFLALLYPYYQDLKQHPA